MQFPYGKSDVVALADALLKSWQDSIPKIGREACFLPPCHHVSADGSDFKRLPMKLTRLSMAKQVAPDSPQHKTHGCVVGAVLVNANTGSMHQALDAFMDKSREN